jgi:hypothetical protein
VVLGFCVFRFAPVCGSGGGGGGGGAPPPRHDEGGISIVNLSLFEPMTEVPGHECGLYMDCIWLYMGRMRCI